MTSTSTLKARTLANAESSSLASRRLLLNGLDGHDLVLELASGRGEEVVDDLVLLDRHRVKEDLLERANAALLYEAAELGDRTVWKTTGE